MKKLILLLLICCTTLSLFAQTRTRYLDSVFAVVGKTTAIYGENYTIATLAVPSIAHTSKQPLVADIYQPVGDTATKRPVMIFVPTGNFLPKSVRQVPTGDRQDSVGVEFCDRFAKMGYVTLSIDYRQVWNPFAGTQTERVFGLINAAYRGIQDLRTAVRYVKANAAALKVDTSKIMTIGDGTGGYITLGAAHFDKYSEVITTARPTGKFVTSVGGQNVPMVIEAYNGDINGTSFGKWPGIAGIPIPAGDTLCIPNHAAFGSAIQLAVNLGGAVGDYTWVEANSAPTISIACTHDAGAPYRDTILLVNTPGGGALPIMQVQGSHWVQMRLDSLKVNDAFTKLKAANDPYKALVGPRNAAAGTYNGTAFTSLSLGNTYASGLLPMHGRSAADGAPWQWWSTDTLRQKYGQDAASLAGNPGMSGEKARKYIDSMMVFIIPRACVALKLPCASLVSSTEELLQAYNTKLAISPNPSATFMTFESEAYNPIQAIEVFDLSGRSVRSIKNINSAQYQMDRGTLSSGMYIAKVKFEGGILSKKIVFEKQ
jgi:hypothetical protein